MSAAAAHFGNLLVGGIDLLHLFLCQVCQGIIVIVIRMVFACQLPVSPFDFFICCGLRYAQDLIGIIHAVSSPFLRFFL